MDFFVGNIIVITKADEPNLFGIFKMLSYSQRLAEPDFYDVEFEFIHGNGSISEDDFYFVSLLHLEGESVYDKNYVHNQPTPAVEWYVQHDLNKFPTATVALSTGQQGFADVTYIDENNLTITFASGESGKAYLN